MAAVSTQMDSCKHWLTQKWLKRFPNESNFHQRYGRSRRPASHTGGIRSDRPTSWNYFCTFSNGTCKAVGPRDEQASIGVGKRKVALGLTFLIEPESMVHSLSYKTILLADLSLSTVWKKTMERFILGYWHWRITVVVEMNHGQGILVQMHKARQQARNH